MNHAWGSGNKSPQHRDHFSLPVLHSAELGQWTSRSHVAAAESKPAACVSNPSQSDRSGCEDKASGCAAAPVSLHTSNGLCQSVCPILRVSLGAKGERRARKEWWVKALQVFFFFSEIALLIYCFFFSLISKWRLEMEEWHVLFLNFLGWISNFNLL